MIGKTTVIRVLFALSALYDGLLGLVFLCAAGQVFQWAEITAPNHLGYVQFPAALLIVFAIMFVAIAVAPEKNRDLIPYGILLKASYCSVVFYHWVAGGIPFMWKPFAVADVGFAVLFTWAYLSLRKAGAK